MNHPTACCKHCNYLFPNNAGSGPCPRCGRKGRIYSLHLEGTVTPTASLVAHKPPVLASLEVNVGDEVGVAEGFVGHGRGSGTEAIRVAASVGQSASADLLEDGSVNFTIRGESRQGEQGVERVCRILIERLNQGGAHWGEPTTSTEPEVDCEASDGHERLKVQVTRTPHDPSVWSALGRTGETSEIYDTADGAADALRTVVEVKETRLAPSARVGITLALDATDTSAYVLQAVVRTFRTRHGTWAKALGFVAIWAVGPTASLTHQLDNPAP